MLFKIKKIHAREFCFCNFETDLLKRAVVKNIDLSQSLRAVFKLSWLAMLSFAPLGFVNLQGFQGDLNLNDHEDTSRALIQQELSNHEKDPVDLFRAERINEVPPLKGELLNWGCCDGPTNPHNVTTHDIAESFSGRSFNYMYGKVGTEVGLGYRHHQNAHGFDISADLIFLALDNWFSVKGLYLHYPFHDLKRYFYVGAGAGAVYEFGDNGYRVYPALEGVIGYEFRSEKKVKTFLQLEAGVPFSPLSQYAVLPVIPALTFGVGF